MIPAVDTYYDRKCQIIIAAPLAQIDSQRLSGQTLEIESLRVQFRVTKTLAKSANTAEVQITNLAEHTRASLQDKSAKIVISAGYLNTLGQIFIGDVRTIDHLREGPDWTTKIDAGDGERALSHARVSESFKAGIGIPDVVTVAAKKMGVDLSSATKQLSSDKRQFVNGYSMHGRASAELDRILTAAGYEWSIQDGRLQILKSGQATTEQIIVLSSDSGLVGSPEFGTSEKKKKPPVIKFKALLSPEIKPGKRIAFDSKRHKGTHRVLKVVHTGDTAGGTTWYTDGEAEVV